MITQTLEALLQEKERETKQHTYTVGAAVGTTLAVAITMYMLKHDITKTYIDMNTRMTTIEQHVEQLETHPKEYVPASEPRIFVQSQITYITGGQMQLTNPPTPIDCETVTDSVTKEISEEDRREQIRRLKEMVHAAAEISEIRERYRRENR